METIFLNYIFPTITFGLGVGFTLIWDKRKKVQSNYEEAATKLSQLVSDWYNQLYVLDIEQRVNSNDFEKRLFFYSQNRLVLPEYLRIITFLKGIKKYSALVKYAEDFLSIVTDYQIKKNQTVSCTIGILDDNSKNNRTLNELDSLLQKIAIESGNSIK